MRIVEWADGLGINMPENIYENKVLQNFQKENGNLIHLFILMYKLLVFENRDACAENNVNNFKARIANLQKIEYQIAMKKGKIGLHLKKWATYLANA